MKPLPLFVLSIVLITACTREASTSAPTALPLNFPVTAPALCQPADLQTSSNSSATAEALFLGITLTNTTRNPCALANPAEISLTSSAGEPYDILTTLNPDVQTPPAPASFLLAPGASSILTLSWRNYCQKQPSDQLILSISLSAGKKLAVPMNVPGLPECQPDAETSTISINPYSNPP